jgi:hypothetical protein
MRKSVYTIAVLLATACTPNNLRFQDMATEWRSSEGYTITISPRGSYTFCDEGDCFTGRYRRPGSPQSIVVELEGFFLNEKTRRFTDRLINLGEKGDIEMMHPDFHFTPTGGLGATEWCGDKPCLIKGSLDTEDHLIFFRKGDI